MLKVLAYTALVLVAFYIAVSVVFYRYVVIRWKKPKPGIVVDRNSKWLRYADEMRSGKDWFLGQKPERVTIRSYDGLKLAGDYLTKEGSKGTILLMHGYRSNVYGDFSCAYRFLHGLGYDLLVAHQRAHGDSEGKYICYGVRERYDCQSWAEFLAARKPEAPTILEGLSMGAATVMMAAELELPDNVRGIIADSGFTSAYDIFAHICKQKLRLPPKPFLWLLGLFSGVVAGFRFKEAGAPEALAKSKLPLLLIHGEDDGFVPAYMSEINYAASASDDKELIIVPGATHGVSYMIDRPRVEGVVSAFLERNTN